MRVCFAAGIAVVGCSTGEIFSHSARDPNQVGLDTAHPSSVTAMVGCLPISTACMHTCGAAVGPGAGAGKPHDSCVCSQQVGHLVVSGNKLVASVSRHHLCLHELGVKLNDLHSVAKVGLGICWASLNSQAFYYYYYYY